MNSGRPRGWRAAEVTLIVRTGGRAHGRPIVHGTFRRRRQSNDRSNPHADRLDLGARERAEYRLAGAALVGVVTIRLNGDPYELAGPTVGVGAARGARHRSAAGGGRAEPGRAQARRVRHHHDPGGGRDGDRQLRGRRRRRPHGMSGPLGRRSADHRRPQLHVPADPRHRQVPVARRDAGGAPGRRRRDGHRRGAARRHHAASGVAARLHRHLGDPAAAQHGRLLHRRRRRSAPRTSAAKPGCRTG